LASAPFAAHAPKAKVSGNMPPPLFAQHFLLASLTTPPPQMSKFLYTGEKSRDEHTGVGFKVIHNYYFLFRTRFLLIFLEIEIFK
jgi:hypothetical protein